jgi:hypothetical protein
MSNSPSNNLFSKLDLGLLTVKSLSKKLELVVDTSFNATKQILTVISNQYNLGKKALEEQEIAEKKQEELKKITYIRPNLVAFTVMASEQDLYRRRLGKYSPMYDINSIDGLTPKPPPNPKTSLDKEALKKVKLVIVNK